MNALAPRRAQVKNESDTLWRLAVAVEAAERKGVSQQAQGLRVQLMKQKGGLQSGVAYPCRAPNLSASVLLTVSTCPCQWTVSPTRNTSGNNDVQAQSLLDNRDALDDVEPPRGEHEKRSVKDRKNSSFNAGTAINP